MNRIALVFIGLLMITSPSWAAIESLSLPEGNPARGREAFIALKCMACHEIRGDNSMRKPTATVPGPKLGVGQARYKSDFLANSIVFPSHDIVPGFGNGKPKKLKAASRMGDFSESMTIRQLADIVAYIKSLDAEI